MISINNLNNYSKATVTHDHKITVPQDHKGTVILDPLGDEHVFAPYYYYSCSAAYVCSNSTLHIWTYM